MKRTTSTTTRYLAAGAGIVVLMIGTAALSSYLTRSTLEEKPVAQTTAAKRAHPQQQRVASAQPQSANPACDDGNLVGTLAGGAAGAAVGNQFGKGNGKTVATVGGLVGGAYLGQRYMPTQNATCR